MGLQRLKWGLSARQGQCSKDLRGRVRRLFSGQWGGLRGIEGSGIGDREVVEKLLSEFLPSGAESACDGLGGHPRAVDGAYEIEAAAPGPAAGIFAEALSHGLVQNLAQRRQGSCRPNARQRREWALPDHSGKGRSKGDLKSILSDLRAGLGNQEVAGIWEENSRVGLWKALVEKPPDSRTVSRVGEEKRSVGRLEVQVSGHASPRKQGLCHRGETQDGLASAGQASVQFLRVGRARLSRSGQSKSSKRSSSMAASSAEMASSSERPSGARILQMTKAAMATAMDTTWLVENSEK